MICLGIDPGITTGYACVKVDLDTDLRYTILNAGTVHYPEGIDALQAFNADYIIIENFKLSASTAVAVSSNDPYLITLRMIGGLHYIWRDSDALVYQLPAEKNGCPNGELRRLNLWHESRHTRDALRHVVVFSRKPYTLERIRRDNKKRQNDS